MIKVTVYTNVQYNKAHYIKGPLCFFNSLLPMRGQFPNSHMCETVQDVQRPTGYFLLVHGCYSLKLMGGHQSFAVQIFVSRV
jgi:hypothetical protein